jgi:glutathione S-transferase
MLGTRPWSRVEKVKLHTCNLMWIRGRHPCHVVRAALDAAGVPYEIVEHPRRKSKRSDIVALSGQDVVPLIEFSDGTAYRAQSRDMAARIAAGTLFAS